MTLKTILLVIAVSTVIGCESRLTFEELMKQGEQYSAEGNTEKSIEAYKKAVAQSPEETSAHEALGNAYYREMAANYRRSATNTQEWEQIKRRGNELRDLAVAEYRKALQKDKDNWEIRYRVAVELFNQKKYKEAIPEFQQTIQSNPKYAVAYSVLASSYLGVGQHDLALKNIEMAHNLDKDNEHYYFSVGKAYYFMNNPNKGFEMETKLKAISSVYYQQFLDYRYSHNKEP
ncbi:MAG: hypothetical protein A2091_13285 [Desulfuromonadales bacterium GWD2_61_12]|nr:MAG: hypothetical protein A2091_13285 [Desulfuromonadales bacterium GWD2_61_12]HAD04051.1 hypothetical protein [Desulfuromonas sp.]